MHDFFLKTPTLDNYWRSLILFGKNTASYKLALGQTLLELSTRGQDFITLDELSHSYALQMCQRIKSGKPQGTNNGMTRFVQACREYNSGELSLEKLIEETRKNAFRYVLDLFHRLGAEDIPVRFYTQEGNQGLRLTQPLFELKELNQSRGLPYEIDARWSLVETAWDTGIPPHMLRADYDATSEDIYINSQTRRTPLTPARDTLNGYQKGHCFYCKSQIALTETDVDHFFPFKLQAHFNYNLNSIWNLVLACHSCNRSSGKWGTKIPNLNAVRELYIRNEYLIASYKPIRATIQSQTGSTPKLRQEFINHRWNDAYALLPALFNPVIAEDFQL